MHKTQWWLCWKCAVNIQIMKLLDDVNKINVLTFTSPNPRIAPIYLVVFIVKSLLTNIFTQKITPHVQNKLLINTVFLVFPFLPPNFHYSKKSTNLSKNALKYINESWENLFMIYANKKGEDQPAHLRSLISTFVVRCQDCIISLVAISGISSL